MTRRASVLAAATLAALSFATANASADAGGTVTLGQFSYTLTDLDPNDGIAPSIVFLPVSGTGDDAGQIKLIYEYGASEALLTRQSIASAPVPLTYGTMSGSASGLASLATTALSASAQASEQAGSGSISSSAWSAVQDFVLSPHTELSIIATGHYSGDLVPVETDSLGLSADILLHATGPFGPIYTYFDANDYNSGYGAPATSIDSTVHVVGAFANDGDTSLSGNLQMVVGVDATAFGFVSSGGGTVATPVPEPAELAMVAAGLPLLGLRLHRRLRRRALHQGDKS